MIITIITNKHWNLIFFGPLQLLLDEEKKNWYSLFKLALTIGTTQYVLYSQKVLAMLKKNFIQTLLLVWTYKWKWRCLQSNFLWYIPRHWYVREDLLTFTQVTNGWATLRILLHPIQTNLKEKFFQDGVNVLFEIWLGIALQHLWNVL